MIKRLRILWLLRRLFGADLMVYRGWSNFALRRELLRCLIQEMPVGFRRVMLSLTTAMVDAEASTDRWCEVNEAIAVTYAELRRAEEAAT